MTISHECRKAGIRKFRKSQFAKKFSCFAGRCVDLVMIVRYHLGAQLPFCVRHYVQFKKLKREWGEKPTFLEKLRRMR